MYYRKLSKNVVHTCTIFTICHSQQLDFNLKYSTYLNKDNYEDDCKVIGQMNIDRVMLFCIVCSKQGN